MKFDRETKDGRKFGLLWPMSEQNGELKEQAASLGAKVQWDKTTGGYRLYEDSIKPGLDVDKEFGKWLTEEQMNAAQAETATFRASAKTIDKAAGIDTSEEKRFYPVQGPEREAFDALRQKTGTKFTYKGGDIGAFIHREGPTEGFERWQTEEAKDAWRVNFEKQKAAQKEERASVENGLDVMKERSNGRDFVADNAKGFMLPSTKQEAVRNSQLDALANAPSEEVAEVFTRTKDALMKLERQQYAVQIKAAQKNDPSMTTADFNAMKHTERAAKAGEKGLPDAQHRQMLALRYGFYKVRERAIELGLVTDRNTAKKLQEQAQKTEQASDGMDSNTKSAPSGASNNMAAALAADAQAAMGR